MTETLAAPPRVAKSEADPSRHSTFVVRHPSVPTQVVVGHGALVDLGARLRELGVSGTVFVISDTAVLPRFGDATLEALRSIGYRAEAKAIPAGEGSKALSVASELYDWLLAQSVGRGDAVVALGGGVVGDLGGFVAATILRGIPWAVVPTTLLGQVDASMGGKTGVNHATGKNLIGAFHHPRLVVSDTALLGTLPRRELRSGIAEIIKTGFILDPELLDLLERRAADLLALEPALTADVVRRCAEHKLNVVGSDERESDLRMILNYGHTIGHGIEAATQYGALLHGEAVAVGMVGAALIAERRGLLNSGDVARHRAVNDAYELPNTAPGVDADRVLAAMAHDKKSTKSSLRWILLDGIGRTRVVSDVPSELALEVIRELVT
ncbi:MAG: 3-dehydroquinate synthase [Chloroflexi bacterium]|nr:3-dehydroquinate synthase [Chloroflexota bacterium]